MYNLPGPFVQPKPKLCRQSAVLVGKCSTANHYFKENQTKLHLQH